MFINLCEPISAVEKSPYSGMQFIFFLFLSPAPALPGLYVRLVGDGGADVHAVPVETVLATERFVKA